MIDTDVRTLLHSTLGRGIWPRFDRTGRVREIVGTARTIAAWAPIFRQHRAALAIAGALRRARLSEQVAELRAHGPAGVALRLAPDCDPETTERVLSLVDRTMARVGRDVAKEPIRY